MSSVLESIKMTAIQQINCNLKDNSSEIEKMRNMLERMEQKMDMREERFVKLIEDLQSQHVEQTTSLRREIEALKQQNDLTNALLTTSTNNNELKESIKMANEKNAEMCLEKRMKMIERMKKEFELVAENVNEISIESWEMETKTTKHLKNTNSKNKMENQKSKEAENYVRDGNSKQLNNAIAELDNFLFQLPSTMVESIPYKTANYTWPIAIEAKRSEWKTDIFHVDKYPFGLMARLRNVPDTVLPSFKLSLSFVNTFDSSSPLIQENIPRFFFVVKTGDGCTKSKGTFHLNFKKSIIYGSYFLEEMVFLNLEDMDGSLEINFYAEPVELTTHIASIDGTLSHSICDFSARKHLASAGIWTTYDLPFVRTPDSSYKIQSTIYFDDDGLFARFSVHPSNSDIGSFMFSLVDVALFDPCDESNAINVTKNFRKNEDALMELFSYEKINQVLKRDVLNIRVVIIDQPPLRH